MMQVGPKGRMVQTRRAENMVFGVAKLDTEAITAVEL
jgi:hypothetical protein